MHRYICHFYLPTRIGNRAFLKKGFFPLPKPIPFFKKLSPGLLLLPRNKSNPNLFYIKEIQYFICRTSQGEISILPLDPLCSLPCYIQRSSSRFFINGGGYAPLERFLRNAKIVLKRRIPSARLRSTSQHAASGLQEFILQTTLTSARGPDRACCCWQTTSTSFATVPICFIVI